MDEAIECVDLYRLLVCGDLVWLQTAILASTMVCVRYRFNHTLLSKSSEVAEAAISH